MQSPATSRRLIIVRLPNWIGDVCMSLPSLQALAEADFDLIVCGRPWAKDLVAQFRAVDFIPLSGRFWSDLKALRTLPKSLRRNALGLVLPDSLSSAALFFLSGIRALGYRDDGRSFMLHWPVSKPTEIGHAVSKWWHLTIHALERWSGAKDFSEIPLPASLCLLDADLSHAHEALQSHKLKAGEFVLVAPTAVGLHHGNIKVWPHFSELVHRFKAIGVPVVACPPQQERAQALAILDEEILIEPLDLRSFCALTTLAGLVVCNDSGVSHLAAAAGAKQLTLFGVTDPKNTRPWSTKAQYVGGPDGWPGLDEVVERCIQMLHRAP